MLVAQIQRVQASIEATEQSDMRTAVYNYVSCVQ